MRNRLSTGLALFGALALLSASACSDDESVANAEVGECVEELPTDGLVSELPEVDCDDPHEAEIFFLFEHEGDDDDFPGVEELQNEAGPACAEEPFEDYVGVAYDETAIDLFPLTPSESSWGDGDRETICMLYLHDESGSGYQTVDESFENAGDDYPIGGGEGDGPTTTGPEDDADVEEQIATLVDECQGGDNAACDELYQITLIGSPEEEVGATCGGRSDAPLDGECVSTLGE